MLCRIPKKRLHKELSSPFVIQGSSTEKYFDARLRSEHEAGYGAPRNENIGSSPGALNNPQESFLY
jgi:hypothetical protein